MPLTIQNRRLFLILITASAILVLPLVAMQFSKEVKWTASDFAVAGLLLFGTGFLIEMALRKTKKGALRILVVLGVLLLFLLVWLELAVGIFGSPWAGT